MAIETLDLLREAMSRLQVRVLYVKPLAENDNSKQGIYVGGGFASIQHLPTESIKKSPNGNALWAELNFEWLRVDGSTESAPGAKLILYKQYPEVRLSGFIGRCSSAPSDSLREIPKNLRRHNNGPDGRMLFLGVTVDRRVVAYLALAGSGLAVAARHLLDTTNTSCLGVFRELPLQRLGLDSKGELLKRLAEINQRGAIPSSRLREGAVEPYKARNGSGYTLEAALGIEPNGRAEPDFMGWEVKSFGDSPITVMTPEPDAGLYVDEGPAKFLAEYGHPSKGKCYFTGTYRHQVRWAATGLRLQLSGFDPSKKCVTDLTGDITLVDDQGRIAASWSYARIAEHWGRKHANAVYVPYVKIPPPTQPTPPPPPCYKFGSPVLLGEGTEFPMLLAAIVAHHVYYDPGVSMPIPKGPVKRRSQFRIRSRDLSTLYSTFTSVAL